MNNNYDFTCDGCAGVFSYDTRDAHHTEYLFCDITGGYAGFTDICFHPRSENDNMFLCHNCVVRMIELFPALRKKFGTGCHESVTSTPCCAHSYSFDGDTTMYPNETLTGWVPKEGN